MHLFTKNNTTQTLLTTHEVHTASKTLIQIQHAKCRMHSENVSTCNSVTIVRHKSSTSRHHYLFDYRTRNSKLDTENSSILGDCAVSTFQGLSIQVVWDMMPFRVENIYPTYDSSWTDYTKKIRADSHTACRSPAMSCR